MADVHFQTHQRELERLSSALVALEEDAGIKERSTGDISINDLRRLYFSVPDKILRKKLIEQYRALRRHADNQTCARIGDAEAELSVLEARGLPQPWVLPSLMACVAVGTGWEIGSMPGALVGAVASFFAGNAYAGEKRNAWGRNVGEVRARLEKLRTVQKEDAASSWRPLVFTDTEEKAGAEDEGTQPEPEIHWAARLGDVAEVKRQIALGASVELLNNDSWGSRPLHRAAANGNAEVVKLLVAEGADVRAPNILLQWLPLHYAASRGCAETIRILLQAGSPVAALDRYQSQPIHLAAKSGNSEALGALLAAGAKVDVQHGHDRGEPIHEAARAGHAQAVEVLIAAGADPNASNSQGVRPLDFASYGKGNSYAKTILVLEAAGAIRKRSGKSE